MGKIRILFLGEGEVESGWAKQQLCTQEPSFRGLREGSGDEDAVSLVKGGRK